MVGSRRSMMFLIFATVASLCCNVSVTSASPIPLQGVTIKARKLPSLDSISKYPEAGIHNPFSGAFGSPPAGTERYMGG